MEERGAKGEKGVSLIFGGKIRGEGAEGDERVKDRDKEIRTLQAPKFRGPGKVKANVNAKSKMTNHQYIWPIWIFQD